MSVDVREIEPLDDDRIESRDAVGQVCGSGAADFFAFDRDVIGAVFAGK